MRLSKKINQLIHSVMVRYVRNQYRKKVKSVLSKHPKMKLISKGADVEKHLALWNRLLPGCSVEWFTLFSEVSSRQDYRFVPEDVFYGVVERCLNNCDAAGFGIEDKSDVCFYFPKKFQPKAFLRYVRGVYFDDSFNPITRKQAQNILESLNEDIVGKPSSGSCGGSNVRCFKRNSENQYVAKDIPLTLDWIELNFDAYVLQERVCQDKATASFNPKSLNTCRMMTFRRPWSGEVSVIATMLRMGCTDEIVDNLAAGGVSVDVDANGKLAPFAVNKYFEKVTHHPASGIMFDGFKVPYYDAMAQVVCEVASRIPSYNLLSFDVVAREDGTPCVIEINATSMTLAQLQTSRPLFGDETEQLVQWCEENRSKFDTFKHLRTFY